MRVNGGSPFCDHPLQALENVSNALFLLLISDHLAHHSILTLILSISGTSGTSDEHISIIEVLKDYEPDGAILVTTPQVSMFFILDYSHDTGTI